MTIRVRRIDAYPIDARANLQEAFDRLRNTEAEALVVERARRHQTPGQTLGVLTADAVAATYRP